VASQGNLLSSGEYNPEFVRALIGKIGAWLPHGYGDAARQLGLFVLADVCYETVRGIAEGSSQRAEAMANAATLIDIESATGTFFEPDLQQALIGHRWIVDVANFAYMNSHFVLTTGFLVWLYLYRNPRFYFVRNMFMVAMGLALVGYTLLPTAPPRLVEGYGFVDTITQYAQVNHDSALVKIFVNPYAAVPSMHVCFALLIGVSGALISRHTFTRALWCVYPLFVSFVVVVTANHFWLDGAAGALVAGLAALAAIRLARVRPAAWSWRPATT
jgi:PAP2 superfamily protein